MKYEKLKDLREDNDMTQTEVANLLGTTQRQYSRWETGTHPLPIEHLKTLCMYYHVSADYILGLPKGMPYGHSKTNR